jgi:hypothetical protein
MDLWRRALGSPTGHAKQLHGQHCAQFKLLESQPHLGRVSVRRSQMCAFAQLAGPTVLQTMCAASHSCFSPGAKLSWPLL